MASQGCLPGTGGRNMNLPGAARSDTIKVSKYMVEYGRERQNASCPVERDRSKEVRVWMCRLGPR